MRLVVDSNIWIKALMPAERQHLLAHDFVRRSLHGQHRITLPYSVITEVVCRLSKRTRDKSIALRHGEQLAAIPYVTWKTIDRRFALEAAIFGFEYELRGMDALVAFTAVQSGSDLLTGDKDFERFKAVSGVLTIRRLGTV